MEVILNSISFNDNKMMFILPLILMALDFVTGTISAWLKQDFKSSKMRDGLNKKVGEVSILVIGEAVTIALKIPYEVMKFFSIWIVVMEITSLFENFDKMGVKIPNKIKSVINNANNALNEKEEKDNEQ